MIMISRLASGALLLQKDDTEVCIDLAAIGTALPGVLLTLIGAQQAIGQARKQGFEDGLTIGRERGIIEAETRQRIAERDMAEASAVLIVAPMAA